MTLRVHGHEASINVRKLLWLCAELGVAVDLVERGTPSAPVSDPAFRALNPFGLVPVIEDGGMALAESNTILRYLARRERRDDLLPTAPYAAALVERWLDWQATDLNESWRYAFIAAFRDLPGYDDPQRIAQSHAAFDAKISIIDAQLAGTGAYVAGAGFTLADIVIGLSIRRWLALGRERQAWPHVMAYHARLCERPAFLRFGGPDSPP